MDAADGISVVGVALGVGVSSGVGVSVEVGVWLGVVVIVEVGVKVNVAVGVIVKVDVEVSEGSAGESVLVGTSMPDSAAMLGDKLLFLPGPKVNQAMPTPITPITRNTTRLPSKYTALPGLRRVRLRGCAVEVEC